MKFPINQKKGKNKVFSLKVIDCGKINWENANLNLNLTLGKKGF